MGLDDSDSIIVRCKEIWNEGINLIKPVDPTDRDTIATAIYTEAWGGCSDRHRELVAAVIVNRVNSNRFPNSVSGVVNQRGQYPQGYANPNSTLGKRARQNPEIWAKCQAIATKALRGEVDCPDNVVFQAQFRQGSGVYDVHKTSYSTTYFCYL
jgi:spore germination cell wall hydrolase CwlJ-like protein